MSSKILKVLFFLSGFFYFLFKRKYQKEIRENYFYLFEKKKFPFSYYLKNLAENLSTMVVVNKKQASLIFDKIKFLGDNIIKGRGGVVVTFHYGIYELLPLIFSQRGYKTAIVYSPQRNPLLNRIFLKLRSKKTPKLLKNLKEIKEALKEGYLVGFAIDNVHKGRLVLLREILPHLKVSSSPFIIAQRFSYPLYFVLIRKNEKDYQVVIKKGFSPLFVKEELKKNIFDWVLWEK
uniref:Lipid A biosynthesis acyltransferase n=1 Tax=candidate division WOR-3 bacterium TaxID=2052148 RepID=A0A7V6CNC9_UNCW3